MFQKESEANIRFHSSAALRSLWKMTFGSFESFLNGHNLEFERCSRDLVKVCFHICLPAFQPLPRSQKLCNRETFQSDSLDDGNRKRLVGRRGPLQRWENRREGEIQWGLQGPCSILSSALHLCTAPSDGLPLRVSSRCLHASMPWPSLPSRCGQWLPSLCPKEEELPVSLACVPGERNCCTSLLLFSLRKPLFALEESRN